MAALRERLKRLKVWPEAADLFLELLPISRWQNAPLTEEDYQWLHKVIDDAIGGIDIGSRYPAFFQKLVTSSKLGQTFLDELDRRLDAS